MSRVDALIEELCPNGVEHKALGDVGAFIRGNGLQKKDLTDAGIPAIHYGQVHTHYGIWTTETISFVTSEFAKRLRKAQPGDLIVATTSEDDAAVGKAVAWLGDREAAVSGDAYIFRHSLDSKYVAYFFQSEQFQDQKRRGITGTKVRRVSGESLGKIRIPVPPLEVQREIVRVLDLFTTLEAELEAELEARRRQYAHYRDEILTFGGWSRWVPMAQVVTIGTGSRNTNEAVHGGRYPFFVRSQDPLTIDEFEFDEVAVVTAGDGVGVGKVFHFVDGRYSLHQRAYRLCVKSDALLPKFLFHFIRHDFARYLAMTSVHASVTSLRKPMFERFPVPLPALAEQERIVAILDKLDALVSDLSVGLPAELAARRKQYEYYRDRLLTFKEAVA